jgi:2-polyprenyl-6-methoxyphenol hydroxylase-like FAD-dependent oxidoreductase
MVRLHLGLRAARMAEALSCDCPGRDAMWLAVWSARVDWSERGTIVVVDVVVVGGGVAGAALAGRLAGAGCAVQVLERETSFTDRVRGEAMVPWGFAEAAALGLADVVLAAKDASVATKLVPYDEGLPATQAEAMALPLSAVVPGAPGMVCVGHPELREALLSHAETCGAVVTRGVDGVTVVPGERPVVTYVSGGADVELTCRLVVVVDGKDSPTRRQLGIGMHQTAPRVTLAGIVVDDGGVWDRSVVVLGIEGDTKFFIQPRGGGRVRLYLAHPLGERGRYHGPGRQQRFLDAFRFDCVPGSEHLAASPAVGPCAEFPMTDGWAERLTAQGVVLAGDAAGWSDPIIGQGLSVAFRDARVLSDLLVASNDWSEQQLAGYCDERTERMRRLRYVSALASLLDLHGVPDRQVRRARVMQRVADMPNLVQAQACALLGAQAAPAEAFEPSNLTNLALV